MATVNSQSRRRAKVKFAAAFCCFFAAAKILFADTTTNPVFADTTTNPVFAAFAQKEFQRAQAQFLTDTNNSTNVWQFARACYDRADFAKNNSDRAAVANQGIDACRQLLAREPKNVAAHYYLAMNLGQLARTEFLGALHLVKEMEREFKTAYSLDDHFDFAGPARNLGLLYLEAPDIGSIGSRRKAREFLQRAVKLAPGYPENHLNLIEAYLKWNDADHAQTELNALDSLWPNAQKKFTGDAWAESWDDWTTRRAAAKKKLAEISAPLKSPRERHWF